MPGKVIVEVKNVGTYYAMWERVDHISDLARRERDCVLALGKNEFHMKYTSFFLKGRKLKLEKSDFRDPERWERELDNMRKHQVAMIATDLFLESKMSVPKHVIVYMPPEDVSHVSKIFERIFETSEKKNRTYKVTFFVGDSDGADFKTALIGEMEKRDIRIPSWLRKSLSKSLQPPKAEEGDGSSMDSEAPSTSSSSSSTKYNKYGYVHNPNWNEKNGIFSQSFWDAVRPGYTYLVPRKVKPSYWGTFKQTVPIATRRADGSWLLNNYRPDLYEDSD
ncbi:unnamed protein product [Caenorhabditis nigoni]